MTKKKIKIEFSDGEGANYSLSLDGSLSRNKVLKILDMVELIDGEEEREKVNTLSNETSFGKLYNLVEKKFPLGSFTSTDILETYEDELNMSIRLSTISTYLSRLEQKKLLTREWTTSGWLYKKTRSMPIQR
jgi:hypothetical protein|tara:strand:+ start:4469 stop:4864 length:396 start_codon:yes stop_codon:yes gene_type:complete